MTVPLRTLAATLAFALLSPVANAQSDPAGALTGPGVSLQLAEQRRQQIRDVRYDLRLAIGAGDTASGSVSVQFTARRPGAVVLDFRGTGIGSARVNGADWREASIAWNRHHLTVPASLVRLGRNTVQIEFSTPVANAGAAIIRTRDAADSSTYLYTLLVPSDANLLFPCFDQPDLKARVTLHLATPPSWRALANGTSARRDSSSQQVTHHFTETKPLSTYLIAFAAGPWAVTTRNEVITPSGAAVPTALYVRASRAKEAESDTLLAMNARALRWLGRYFGVPYGFDKYDALLAPAFPFGGMEHPGAVFYNEESFIYRERPTTSQLLGRQATTFHEVAHQWFGDYVTMQWFDDLWLKEGFATFMAARMQADLEPKSNAWKTFYLRNKPTAYGTDATAGTTPVWQRLANLDQAKSNYGPIVYNKAPSILRQLEYLVGPAAFQRGVQQFLRTHAYGNATWQALLQSIGAASGRDLRRWGTQWMLRPGMPIISQQLETANGRITRLRLVQRPAQPSMSGTGAWPLKVQVRLHYTDRPSVSLPIELRGDTTVITAAAGRPAPAFVFANEGDYGYAIVLPDSMSVAWLEAHVSDVKDDFLRAMLWGSLWDLVREGELAPVRYARMAMRALPHERDEQLASALVGRLSTAVARYAAVPVRDALLPEMERLLLAGAQDTTAAYGTRKAHLDSYIALARRDGAQRQLRRWLAGDSAAGLPLRPPTRWAMVTSLVSQGATDRDSLVAAERQRDNTTEGQRQAFVAGAAAPDSATKQFLFDRWFRDASLNEEWVTSSLRAFHDPEQQRLTRRYLVAALDTLPWIQKNRRIFFLGSWLGATIGGQTEREALTIIDGWLASHPSLATDLRQKILQSRDELERTVRVRERFAASAEQTAAEQVIERWIAALNTRDTVLMRETLLPRGWVSMAVRVPVNGAIAPATLPRYTTDSAQVASLPGRSGRGRLGLLQVTAHGPLVYAAAPYHWLFDDGRVQGCGADLFTMVKHLGAWRLSAVEYSQQTDACGDSAQLAASQFATPVAPAEAGSDGANAVRVSEAVLRALSARDTATLRTLMLPAVSLLSVNDPAGESEPVRLQDAGTFFSTLSNGRERLLERLWSPTVSVFGPVAHVRAPYDFHIDGTFSHCGTDQFTLVKMPDGAWRVARIAYTKQRVGCRPSPLGPPS